MSNRITPQQAFEHLTALWPDTAEIRKHNHGDTLLIAEDGLPDRLQLKIDWPEGVDRWPMPELKWRDARMPEDYGKAARFSNGSGTHDEKFYGMLPSGEHRYIDQNGIAWRHCQVRDENRFAGEEPEDGINPGDGWRLIDKSKDTPKSGDQVWYEDGKYWDNRAFPSQPYKETYTYRRRIESPNKHVRPYTQYELKSAKVWSTNPTSKGWIVGASPTEVTFKQNDITETRRYEDCSDITWEDGSPFGVVE